MDNGILLVPPHEARTDHRVRSLRVDAEVDRVVDEVLG
jgi:hypothetical protein